jgi:hypothetical protein
MEKAIQNLLQQKIQEVLRACGINECGNDPFADEVAAISKVGASPCQLCPVLLLTSPLSAKRELN